MNSYSDSKVWEQDPSILDLYEGGDTSDEELYQNCYLKIDKIDGKPQLMSIRLGLEYNNKPVAIQVDSHELSEQLKTRENIHFEKVQNKMNRYRIALYLKNGKLDSYKIVARRWMNTVWENYQITNCVSLESIHYSNESELEWDYNIFETMNGYYPGKYKVFRPLRRIQYDIAFRILGTFAGGIE
jgi:hypothetical protein